MRRREFLSTTALTAAAAVPVLPALAGTAARAAVPGTTTVTTSGGRDLSGLIPYGGPTLRSGTPDQARLITRYADRTRADAAAGLQPGTGADGHPMYPGEVVLAARDGVIAEYAAAGYNLRYADANGTELPPAQWIPASTDTIYDLASLTKLFTSVAAVQLMQQGKLSLTEPVVTYLPEYASNGKSDITILQLLTHTSGLPPDPSPPLWTYPDRQQMVAAVMATKPQAPAGTQYIYSDLNMITLQFAEERITGKTLDVLVRDGITGPLGMADTMFNPPASLKHRIAAEEYELAPDRGLVWGEVHDENAWALGGVAGHAGLFSTARDLAIFCQAILNGGAYGPARILTRDSVIRMLTNYNQAFPGNEHGLGFELYQIWEAGALATPYSFAHTGFTGTSLAGDPTTGSFAILLTNRVHPSRDWGSTNPARRAVGYDVARAVAVRPDSGRGEWFAGMADNTTTTLTLPLTLPASAWLSFGLWYDTEPGYDFLYLEASRDGGKTWAQLPFRARGWRLAADTPGRISGYQGRQWLRADAALSGWTGAVQLRWRYATDSLYHGRGVYIDAVTVRTGDRIVFDDRRPGDAAAFQSDGWVRTDN